MQYNTDMESQYKELFLSARKLILLFDSIVETKKKRITTYSDKNAGLCHMRTMKHGIDIGFLKGSKMEDKFGLLSGNGKVMRVLSFKTINKTHINYYMAQAIEINVVK